MSGKLPPGPPYPGIVNTILWLRFMMPLLERSRRRYGDVWTLRLMGGAGTQEETGTKQPATMVFVADPALVEQVLTADTSVLGGEAKVITPLVGKNSVLVLDGPEHTTQRKLLLPSLHGDKIDGYHDNIARLCEEEIASWSLSESFQLLPRMEELTLSAIMTVIFGMTIEDRREELRRRVRALTRYRDKPSTPVILQASYMRGKDPPGAFKGVMGAIDEMLYEEIKRTREDPDLGDRGDVLASLVQAKHDDGSPMSDEEIRDELITLLIQGHTSTATALSWALERVVRHPDVHEKLRAEADTDSDEYLDAVIKETLRLRTPIPVVGRRVAQPYQLGEWELPPGTMIMLNALMLHQHSDIYPEPDRFRPERFLEQPAGKYTWIPFGGGPRACIGRSFATLEMKIVLRMLTSVVRLAPVKQQDERLRRRGVVLSPTEGARMKLLERSPAVPAAVS
jgi:cytochrome P450 family 135